VAGFDKSLGCKEQIVITLKVNLWLHYLHLICHVNSGLIILSTNFANLYISNPNSTFSLELSVKTFIYK